MVFKYPATDYDRAQTLLATLGSFWTDVYGDQDQIESIIRAKASVENQTVQDLTEAVNVLARNTVPVYHVDNWYRLSLLESDKNNGDVAIAKFNGSINYNDGSMFDVPQETSTFAFPVPDDLVTAPMIMNRFTAPSLVMTLGQDYVLEPGRVVFVDDPFEDDRVAKRHVYDDGVVIDEEATLWVFKGQYDWDVIYNQYGYIIGLSLQSSNGYRDLMDAVFDAIVGGTARKQIERAASAMSGIPLVLEQTETVVDVSRDNNNRLIITDQHVYKFAPSALVTVNVGDALTAGDSMVDSLELIELNSGNVPSTLRALAIGKGFLATCYFSELIFENKEVPLEVTEADDHASGFTFVKFGLGGFPADVDQFFEDVHNRGIAVSQEAIDDCDENDLLTFPGSDCDDVPTTQIKAGTLAHLLDTRPNKIGEPSALVLPPTINPLQFLVKNVLRCNASILRIKVNDQGDDAIGLYSASLLRKIVPPHTAVIIVYELSANQERFDGTGLDDVITTFTAMELLVETINEATAKESISTIRVISGTCQ